MQKQNQTLLTLRNYQPEDCEVLAQLFYNTVHTVNAADYTEEQLDAWADGTVNLEKWNGSFLENNTIVAVVGMTVAGFGDMDGTGYLDRLYIHRDYLNWGIGGAICDRLEGQSGAARFQVHASVTARHFFEKRGYHVIREQQVQRKGVQLTNYVMEKENGEAGRGMEYRLKTERLSLRPLRPEDFDAVWEYAGDRESIRYMIYFPHESPEETARFLEDAHAEWRKEEPHFFEFAVLLGEQVAGGISLWLEADDCVEIGWILNRRYRGFGYMAEAAEAVIRFAAEHLHVKQVIAFCDTRNTASVRLMEKLGMQREKEQERIYERTGETAREYRYIRNI